MSVSNHDYKEQFNARFEAEKEARQWESKYTDLLKRVREAVEEIEKAEKKYEQQFYAGKRLNVHPIEYTEGLVSGYKSAWIYLHQHGLIEEDK